MVKAHSMRRGLLLLPLVLLAGCVPVVNQRGYLPNPTGEAAIKAAPSSVLARALLAQRLIEPREKRIDEGLSQIVLAQFAQPFENEPGVKHEHVEAPIDGIRDTELLIENRLTRTPRNRGA